MNKKYKIIIGIIVIVVILAIVLNFTKDKKPQFTGDDLIHVFYPLPQDQIQSPLVVTGEARGQWYFEASFPVILTNWDGLIIAQGIAEAQGEWMTTDFVPFTATLEFIKPDYGDNGFLILQKDNPSGLPQYDSAWEIPINFL